MVDNIDKIAKGLQEIVLEGYSEKFKDEFLNPRNIGKMQDPDGHANITGICGDTIEMYLTIEHETISDIKFMTDGCGATIACASYITRIAKGKSLEEALRIKPQDVDDYFQGLPEKSKHCTKLSVSVLKAALSTYESNKQNQNFSRMEKKEKDTDGRTRII